MSGIESKRDVEDLPRKIYALGGLGLRCGPALGSHLGGEAKPVILLLLVAFSMVLVSGADYRDVSVQGAFQLIQENRQLFLLDVRTRPEYEEGHIGGAHLLPYDQVSSRTGELPVDRGVAILVYCRSGVRSSIAAGTLANLGYANITNMLGGFSGWKASGYPYVTGPEMGVKPISELGAALVSVFLPSVMLMRSVRRGGKSQQPLSERIGHATTADGER